jgi:U3 small nucleolar RNA-associated protein 25
MLTRTVNMIISILLGNQKGVVMNQKRYIEEFSGEELALPKKNPKPEDYEHLFRGNTDDNFRIGMSITKKRLKVHLKHCPITPSWQRWKFILSDLVGE